MRFSRFIYQILLEEYQQDRPREYAELVESGELKSRVVKAQISETRRKVITIFGFTVLFIGLSSVALINFSVLFGYN
jgi:hypothetical protein